MLPSVLSRERSESARPMLPFGKLNLPTRSVFPGLSDHLYVYWKAVAAYALTPDQTADEHGCLVYPFIRPSQAATPLSPPTFP